MQFRIGIDALGINQPGGARTAVLYLMKELFRISPEWNFTIFLSEKEIDFDNFENVKQVILPFKKGISSRIGAQLFFFFNTLFKKYDLFHFTKSQGCFTFSKLKILTIFDLTILNNPSQFKRIDVLFWKFLQPLFLRHFNKIITISNNAKEDIIRFYNLEKTKIQVIYCSSQFDQKIEKDLDLIRKVQLKYKINFEYILFLGIIALKKNLSTIVKAYKLLIDDKVKIPKLILAGPFYPQSDGSNIIQQIKEFNIENEIMYIGKVNQEDLIGLYQGSRFLLMPSIHEGFGIPVLEALQCGIPVIASNTSSIPEVLGNAGVLINDFMNSQEWSKEIVSLLNDKNKYDQLIEKGKFQIGKFSWKKSGRDLKNLYINLLENS